MPHDPGLAPGDRAEGAAFPVLVKFLATVLMAALMVWGLRVASDIATTAWTWGAIGFMLAAGAVILLCYYWILCSRTSIDAHALRQTWMWPKEVRLADITQAKFIYVPYLSWLIAPRLVVRARGGGMYIFHAADMRVLQAFARLSLGPVFDPD